jgi:hypothetical protein
MDVELDFGGTNIDDYSPFAESGTTPEIDWSSGRLESQLPPTHMERARVSLGAKLDGYLNDDLGDWPDSDDDALGSGSESDVDNPVELPACTPSSILTSKKPWSNTGIDHIQHRTRKVQAENASQSPWYP